MSMYTPIDKSTLIERSQLLVAIRGNHFCKPDPFEMRLESANPESQDEIIAIIKFEGLPELQEQLRSLCREYIDIFSTSVRSLSAHLDTIQLKSNLPSLFGVIEESQASEWSQVRGD